MLELFDYIHTTINIIFLHRKYRRKYVCTLALIFGGWMVSFFNKQPRWYKIWHSILYIKYIMFIKK